MIRIAFRIARFLTLHNEASPASNNVALRLMEDAQARAGSHPYQAQELREAASAYLSVVR